MPGYPTIVMSVSLRQLNGFVLVAQMSSFTRAAERLSITQAGLSAMMRDLEKQFDCRLFDRTTRTVSLTKQGASLLPTAMLVLKEMDRARVELEASSKAKHRLLTIAATPVAASVLMPSVCRAFAEIEPSVQVRVIDVARSQIRDLVERGEADIGFGIFLKPTAGGQLRRLLNFRLVFIEPGKASDSAASSKAGSIARLAWSRVPDRPLISLPADTPVQQVIDDQMARLGRQIVPGQVCNSMLPVVSMVAAGLGSAILPSMIMPSCPASKFRLRWLSSPATQLPFYQLTKKGHHITPLAAPFVRTLTEVITRVCGAQPSA